MKYLRRKKALFLLILFLFAFGLRLSYLNQLRSSPMFDAPIMDAKFHDRWAGAILMSIPPHEGPYFRAPLYPYFLASIYALSDHSYVVVRVIQFLMGSLSVVLIYFLGKRVFNSSVGKLAAVLASVYGIFIYFEGELLIPVLIVFLDIILLLAILSTVKRPRWWRWLGCGALLGLSALARPNIVIFLAVLLPWMFTQLYREGLHLRRIVGQICALSLGVILAIAPVTVRNYVTSGDFVPIASQGGVNFFIGNNRYADGTTAIVPGTRASWYGGYLDAIRLAEESEGRSLKASEVSNYWFKKGLKFWKEEPKIALRLLLRKFLLFWGGPEISNNKDVYFFSKLTPLLGILVWSNFISCPFGIVAPFALAGIVTAWRRRQGQIGLMILFVFSYMIGILIFFVTARYRVPIIPFLLPFSAYTLICLFRVKRVSQIVLPVVLLLIFGMLVNLNWAHYASPSEADSHAKIGYSYLNKKLYNNAISEFRSALSKAHHDNSSTLAELNATNGLAQVYYEMSQYNKAIDLWEQTLLLMKKRRVSLFQLGPDLSELRYKLGCSYHAVGSSEKAILQWRETVRLNPKSISSYLKLSNAYREMGHYDEAITILKVSLQKEPRSSESHYALGNLYVDLGRLDEAIQHYRQAIQFNPLYADAYFSLSQLYSYNDRNLDEGIALISKALLLDRNNTGYWKALADLYYKKGEVTKAQEILSRTMQIEQDKEH